MAHDPDRSRTVLLFAGEFSESPPPRYETALAYDADRGRTVLFGSRHVRTPYRDTWEWDGTTWTQRFPRDGPTSGGHLAYDSVRRRTVFLTAGQTWEWNGTEWTRRSPAANPSVGGPVAFDSRRGVTVFSNGSETWEWDGAEWTRRLPAAQPGFRQENALAYDVARGRTVLFGGGDFTPCVCSTRNDLWEWDGTEWTARPVPLSPSPRVKPVMAYDSARARMVLFGGHSHSCSPPSQESGSAATCRGRWTPGS